MRNYAIWSDIMQYYVILCEMHNLPPPPGNLRVINGYKTHLQRLLSSFGKGGETQQLSVFERLVWKAICSASCISLPCTPFRINWFGAEWTKACFVCFLWFPEQKGAAQKNRGEKEFWWVSETGSDLEAPGPEPGQRKGKQLAQGRNVRSLVAVGDPKKVYDGTLVQQAEAVFRCRMSHVGVDIGSYHKNNNYLGYKKNGAPMLRQVTPPQKIYTPSDTNRQLKSNPPPAKQGRGPLQGENCAKQPRTGLTAVVGQLDQRLPWCIFASIPQPVKQAEGPLPTGGQRLGEGRRYSHSMNVQTNDFTKSWWCHPDDRDGKMYKDSRKPIGNWSSMPNFPRFYLIWSHWKENEGVPGLDSPLVQLGWKSKSIFAPPPVKWAAVDDDI